MSGLQPHVRAHPHTQFYFCNYARPPAPPHARPCVLSRRLPHASTGLAEMHLAPVYHPTFGFPLDGYCGNVPQKNNVTMVCPPSSPIPHFDHPGCPSVVPPGPCLLLRSQCWLRPGPTPFDLGSSRGGIPKLSGDSGSAGRLNHWSCMVCCRVLGHTCQCGCRRLVGRWYALREL